MLRLTPTVITINRTTGPKDKQFKMTLWKMKGNIYKRLKTYTITIGAIGHATPPGLYFIQYKSTKPSWQAPDADWVPEEKRGVIYPFEDPSNPFAGGFLSLGGTDGVGIHGVKFDPQLGTRSSHGCIRMATEDFLEMYDRVPKNTPVFIY